MVGAIIGGISAHNAGGNVWAGAAVGAVAGYFGAGIANIATSAMGISIATGTATGFGASAGASWGGSIITPLEGALITGTEFAIGGFAAGLASGYAGGEGSVGDMFAQAGIGAGIGFGSGFAIGYSYTAGWQNILHGADTQAANARTIEVQQHRVANMMETIDDAYKQDSLLGRVGAEREIAKSQRWWPKGVEKWRYLNYGNYCGPGNNDPTYMKQAIDELDMRGVGHDKFWDRGESRLGDWIFSDQVRRLPADPSHWNPPAPNPSHAFWYRLRAQFVFNLRRAYIHWVGF